MYIRRQIYFLLNLKIGIKVGKHERTIRNESNERIIKSDEQGTGIKNIYADSFGKERATNDNLSKTKGNNSRGSKQTND